MPCPSGNEVEGRVQDERGRDVEVADPPRLARAARSGLRAGGSRPRPLSRRATSGCASIRSASSGSPRSPAGPSPRTPAGVIRMRHQLLDRRGDGVVEGGRRPVHVRDDAVGLASRSTPRPPRRRAPCPAAIDEVVAPVCSGICPAWQQQVARVVARHPVDVGGGGVGVLGPGRDRQREARAARRDRRIARRPPAASGRTRSRGCRRPRFATIQLPVIMNRPSPVGEVGHRVVVAAAAEPRREVAPCRPVLQRGRGLQVLRACRRRARSPWSPKTKSVR